jgi:putative ABC transport system ATP-binding protein
MTAAPPPVLDVCEATKLFGHGRTLVRAVDHASMSARAGHLTLVMGPSGSGKTTLLCLVGALLRPTSGAIVLGGTDLAGLGPRALTAVRRRSIGFVFQGANLLASLSALENVQIALDIAGRHGREATATARRALVEIGLGDRLGFRPHELSGGERQRVAIARAVVGEPLLLLADEPTANLDSQGGLEVMGLLHRLAAEQGRTVIVVSHDVRLEALADRIYHMEDGRLRAGEG